MCVFSFLTLFEKNTKLGEEILEDSINLLELFDKDLIIVQKALKKNNKDDTVKLRVKKKIHTRITGLYYCPIDSNIEHTFVFEITFFHVFLFTYISQSKLNILYNYCFWIDIKMLKYLIYITLFIL